MSLSRPNIKNPAVRFMQWRGGEAGGGKVQYYDKETEENVDVPLPFTFLVLDELNTISGFNDNEKSSYWSNEVRNLMTDEFTVRTKSGVKARGKYAELGDVKSRGAKYAKSVYIAYKDETGEMIISNLRLMGAALTAWIEFQKKFDVSKCAVSITAAKKAKKGATTYFMPIFEGREMSDTTRNEAIRLDVQLQAYLDSYFVRQPDMDEVTETKDNEITSAPDVTIESDDDTIDVSEVPY